MVKIWLMMVIFHGIYWDIWGFPSMGGSPGIIHFRLGFSKFSPSIWGDSPVNELEKPSHHIVETCWWRFWVFHGFPESSGYTQIWAISNDGILTKTIQWTGLLPWRAGNPPNRPSTSRGFTCYGPNLVKGCSMLISWDTGDQKFRSGFFTCLVVYFS